MPDGYFDGLEQQIVSFIKLVELKNETSEQGFTVPENYFEELNSVINSRITIEAALDKEGTGFDVPEDYFESLSTKIQSRIAVQESLSNSTEAFAVPQNYFDDLTDNILNKTVNQPDSEKQETVKRKGIIRRMFAPSAIKYATAACITLAVGGTIFLSQNNNAVKDHNHSFLHQSLSAVPVDEIRNYLQQNIDPSDTRTLIDESKQVNADNLNSDLQDELDTSQ